MPRHFLASRRSRLFWPILLTLVACLTPAIASAADVGGRIEPFTLPDIHGRDRSLAEFAKSDIVVVAFLGAECPLARLYGPRLQELSDAYAARGVAFVGIDGNQQDSLIDMAAYARQFGVKFPLLKDRDGAVADQFGAVRNPEVFVLDRDRAIRYRGRVDDQYGLGGGSGYARTELKQRNLGQALDEILAGKAVSAASTPVTGCIIGRAAKTAPKGDITFTKHIATIMQNRCQECHRPGQVGPFTLTDYEDVAGWGAMIKEVVSEGRMPPWSANPKYGHFSNDARLTDDEKKLLFTWLDNGCPEGTRADLPPAKQWTEGWRIPKPDQIVRMEKPFVVPAEGVVDYKNFVVDPGWTEDKWIKAAEALPGNRAVVHHIIVSAIAPGGSLADVDDAPEGAENGQTTGRGRRSSGARIGVGGYAPGSTVLPQPEGVALYVPAGSKISFQMHYTPNGTEQADQSSIGFVFADPKDVKKIVHGGGAMNLRFTIPPHADNHEVTSEHVFTSDQLLFRMMPHMHLRGKSFRFEAMYPDGTSEILLDVPKYDFNWQITYFPTEPKLMPKGTKLQCTASFDNSENNLANPDPNETVKWGPQTWHEMMIGWFGTLSVEDDAPLVQAQAKK